MAGGGILEWAASAPARAMSSGCSTPVLSRAAACAVTATGVRAPSSRCGLRWLTAAHAAGTDANDTPPLWDGLGDLGYPVTTGSRWRSATSTRALRLTWAFNHAEALRRLPRGRAARSRNARCATGARRSRSARTSMRRWTRRRRPRRFVTKEGAGAAPQARANGEQALIAALAARYSDAPDADRSAGPGLRRCDGRGPRALPRRPGRRGAVRRCGHEHLALGLLGGRRPHAQGPRSARRSRRSRRCSRQTPTMPARSTSTST